MREIVLTLAAILLFGCVSQHTTDNASTGSAIAGSQAGQQDRQWADQPPVNTSGLYFERNASDVMNTNTTFPETQNITFDFSNITTPDGRLIVYYFYSSGCSACKALRPEIDRLEAGYPDVLWLEYDIAHENGSIAYKQFAAQHNLSMQQKYVPQVLVDGIIITDRFNINKSLEATIKNSSAE